jgi:hypothetical protein
VAGTAACDPQQTRFSVGEKSFEERLDTLHAEGKPMLEEAAVRLDDRGNGFPPGAGQQRLGCRQLGAVRCLLVARIGGRDARWPTLWPPGPQRINFEEVSKDESIITFSSDLLFDFDKSEIKAPFGLAAVGLFIKLTSARRVLIDGHTDSINRSGQPNYNQRLSERRANAVKHFLVSHDFVSPKDVEAKGHGDTMPVAPNMLPPLMVDNPEGRALNRRVEIRVLNY